MNKEKEEKNKGITLISLVLSIIVLLILAGVSLSLVVGETGIVERASKTKNVTETAELQEKIKIAAMAAQVEGLGTIPSIDVLKSELDSAIGTDYEIENSGDVWRLKIADNVFYIDKNADVKIVNNWDDIAAPEDCFYWASDDPASEDYGTVIGYKAKIDNYTFLRFPSRCTKIELFDDSGTEEEASRTYTQNIKKVEIPGTVKYISDYAFGDPHEHNTFSKCEEIILNNGITHFDGAFKQNKSLKKIIIPESVTTIGGGAFSGCSSLNILNIPESVTTIGGEAFSGCSSLNILNIPESVTTIGGGAFSGCSGLNVLIIPEHVTFIGGQAFYGCVGLTEITIPINVNYIGEEAFLMCTNLQNINIRADSIPLTWDSWWYDGCSATINLGYTGE